MDESLPLFAEASLAAIVAPGPGDILVFTRCIRLGRVAALVSAAESGFDVAPMRRI